MERKIGEIFEYNGEWYQCITDTTDDGCNNCFFQKSCSDITGDCSSIVRSDGESVAFKKLEKVGEPYEYFIQGLGIILQEYILANPSYTCDDNKHVFVLDCQNGRIAIELKQNQEDMEENKLNLKPFDIQKAKDGKPVCTRNGKKARIICFDVKAKKPIAALITNDDTEEVHFYYDNGRSDQYLEYRYDLMMLPEKKEGWVNIYNDGGTYYSKYIYKTEKEQADTISPNHVATVKIEWYE